MPILGAFYTLKNLYETVELPLVEVLADMELAGVGLDKEYLANLSVEVEEAAAENLYNIERAAGHPVNPRSPIQLQSLLYKEMGEPVVRRSKTGAPSTDKFALDLMATPVAQYVKDYKESKTALSNFIYKLPRLALSDGRVHGSFNQAGYLETSDEVKASPATGRISSSDPNLQQISARGMWGEKIRRGIVPKRGYCFVSGDIGQEEYRLACYAADETTVLPLFTDPDFDPHLQTKNDLSALGVDLDRQDAKTANYALIYGVGPHRLLTQIPGLLTIPATNRAIEAFFTARPRLRPWHSEVIASTRKFGYSESFFGRRRYLPSIWSGIVKDRMSAEREAVNQVIQGTGADIMKMALRRVWEAITPLDGKLILTSHDDVVVECPLTHRDSVARIVGGMTEGLVPVTLPVEVKTGHTWGDMKLWREL
jgi:DNA polymerase-1